MPPETVRVMDVAPAGAVVVKVDEPHVGVELQTTGVEVDAPAGADVTTDAAKPPTVTRAATSVPARAREARR